MAKRSTMTGGRAIAGNLRRITPGIVVPLNESSRKALKPMLAAARANAPKDKGDLKRSLVIKKRSGSSKTKPVHVIGPSVDYQNSDGDRPIKYAHIAEWGRAPNANGKGGMPGTRFLTRAFDATAQDVLRIFGNEIGPAIERRAAKLAKKAGKT